MSTIIPIVNHSHHPLPAYATQGSSGLDLRAFVTAPVQLAPLERVLIPTGIVLDIPEGYSVRLHARSGLAIKGGIVLANSEGVIDSDYTDQLMVAVMNLSSIPVRVTHGDRICQGEMIPVLKYSLEPTDERVQPKTSRKGGFGSTGVS